MIRRTADAGLGVLVLTVDVPAGSKRERNIRNGFANVRGGLLQALSLKPSILAEALTHPGWIVDYLRHGGGTSMMQNWQPYAPNGANAEAVYNFAAPCSLTTRRPGAIWIITGGCSRAISSSRGS
jgi:(S)-mandelate dehydrogenase